MEGNCSLQSTADLEKYYIMNKIVVNVYIDSSACIVKKITRVEKACSPGENKIARKIHVSKVGVVSVKGFQVKWNSGTIKMGVYGY